MKFKDVLGLFGVRKPTRTYGFEIETFQLPKEGKVRFAQWLHPKCSRTVMDQAAVDELRHHLRPGSAVLDIGAHAGDTSVLFALAVGPTGRVFAVEPNSYVLGVLRENAKLNPAAAPIEVLPYAATMEDAKLTFQYSDEGFCNGGALEQFGRFRHGHIYELEVEGRNIMTELRGRHSEWLSRISMIKTDTEGNDQTVVDSLRELIMAQRPLIVAEVYKRTGADQRRRFHQTLDSMGYDIYLATPWTALRQERMGPDDMMREPHFDIFCEPRESR